MARLKPCPFKDVFESPGLKPLAATSGFHRPEGRCFYRLIGARFRAVLLDPPYLLEQHEEIGWGTRLYGYLNLR